MLSGHTLPSEGVLFLASAGLSQLISNVPATVIFLGSKPEWLPLALGVNLGGNGLVVGSLANIIAIRISGIRMSDFHRFSMPYFPLDGFDFATPAVISGLFPHRTGTTLMLCGKCSVCSCSGREGNLKHSSASSSMFLKLGTTSGRFIISAIITISLFCILSVHKHFLHRSFLWFHFIYINPPGEL